jgi:pimeloyl-ACP methyl ester carboxylesterase
MKKLLNIYILFWMLCPFFTTAQTWASYSTQLPTKEYWGHKFKLSASIKTDIVDDSASARIWARVDRGKGEKRAFFYNMDDRPVRNKEWKTYTIEGVIDSNTTKIAYGTLTELNGRFYYDDIQLDIETSKNTWKTVYKNDFQQETLDLQQGIQLPSEGKNPNFTARFEKKEGNQYLKIEGGNIIDFGNNAVAGKYAEVNGVKLYYETYGRGQPLVVLQGLAGSIERLSHFYPELIKNYQVIAVDNRGIGKSTDTDQPFTYETMASDINQLLEQLHIDSALVLSVQDGMVGLLLAKDYPKKVKKLFAFGLRLQQDSSAVKQSVITASEKFMKETQDPKIKKIGVLASRRDYPNMPFSELSLIKAPVLVMGVDKGPNVKEHVLKIYKTLPNGQFCYIPGTANDVVFKKSALLLSIIRDFFDE